MAWTCPNKPIITTKMKQWDSPVKRQKMLQTNKKTMFYDKHTWNKMKRNAENKETEKWAKQTLTRKKKAHVANARQSSSKKPLKYKWYYISIKKMHRGYIIYKTLPILTV